MKTTQLFTIAILAFLPQLALASAIRVVDENDDPIPFKQITVADSVPFGSTSIPISYITDANGYAHHTPGPAICFLVIRVQDCSGIWKTFVTNSLYQAVYNSWNMDSPVKICGQVKPSAISLNFYWRKSIFAPWQAPPVPTNFWLKHYKLTGSTPQLVGNYSFNNKSSLDTSFPHQDIGRFLLQAIDCTGDTISTIWDYDYNQSRIYQSRVWICDSFPTDSLIILVGGLIIGAHNYLPIVLKDSSFSNASVQYDTLNTDFFTNTGGYNFVSVDDTIPQPGNAKLTFMAQTCGGFLPVYEVISNSSLPRITDSTFDFCAAYNFAVSEFALKPKAIVLPNPFSESIKINLAEEQRNTRINLYSMQGNVLLTHYTTSGLEVKFETENLPVGMYLIEITSQAGTEIHKAVKR